MKVGRIEQLTHTPGPWRISTLDSRTIGPERGLTAHGTTVTQLQAVARITERGTESEANARLIAAAPELLAALKQLDAFVRLEEKDGDDAVWTDGYRGLVEDIRAAIAKAEGRYVS